MDQQIVSFERFFKDESLSDVKFVLRNRQKRRVEIPAHRIILSNRSEVFNRMFNGALKEGHMIEITDVYAEEFSEYLQFFYLSKVRLKTKNIGGVLKLIDKYDSQDFYPICEAFMEKSLTHQLLVHYYELVLSFDLSEKLKKTVERMIAKDWKTLLRECTDLRTDTFFVEHILKSNELPDPEIVIFNMLMEWIKNYMSEYDGPLTEARISEKFGNIIEVIRFPIMTSKELVQCFYEYPHLLKPEEMADLMSYSINQQPLDKAARFNCQKRARVDAKRILTLYRMTQMPTHPIRETTFVLKWDGQSTPINWMVSLFLVPCIAGGLNQIQTIRNRHGYSLVPVGWSHILQKGPVVMQPIQVDRKGGYEEIHVTHFQTFASGTEYVAEAMTNHPPDFSISVYGSNYSISCIVADEMLD